MNQYMSFGIIFVILFCLEVVYFKIADRFNIIDKPNERSSHSSIVLRGGGIIFMLSLWIWSAFFGFQYVWFLLAVTLIAGVSFVDDIRSLPDSVRLVAQFVAMVMLFYQLDILHWNMWWMVLVALVVCVGAADVINFMDGVNGITGAYALASLVPLALLNAGMGFVAQSLIYVVILATGDITWLIFLLVYGVDGCLTIVHRIMLHENLGEAHRKHAYQLMANELGIGHVKVASFYALLQLAISLGFVYLCPMLARASGMGLVAWHWIYLVVALVVLAVAYVLFMRKFYHLHEEYLRRVRGER